MLIIIICNTNLYKNQVRNEGTTNPSPNQRCKESGRTTSKDKPQNAVRKALARFSWRFGLANNAINRGSIKTSLLVDPVLHLAPKLKTISRAPDWTYQRQPMR